MRTAEIICAVVILAVGVVVCYDSTNFGIVGWGDGGPEAGLYPFLLGAGTILASAVIVGQTIRRRHSTPPRPFLPTGAWRPVASVAIPTALMLFMTQFIGLYLAAGVYLAVYMRWIGKHRWLTVSAVSVLVPLVGYIVFQRWFLIPLPEGSVWARFGL